MLLVDNNESSHKLDSKVSQIRVQYSNRAYEYITEKITERAASEGKRLAGS